MFFKIFDALRLVSYVLFCFIVLNLPLFSQNGTPATPFTSLSQITGFPAGNYVFNMAGTTFTTYIDGTGWMLVATNSGTYTGSLNQVSNLTITSNAILSPTILASIQPMNGVRISSSDAVIDVSTSIPTIISRVKNNKSLNTGSLDNSLYGTVWAGTNAAWFNNQSCSCNDGNNLLHVNVYHPTCDPTKFHWLPYVGQMAEKWSLGFVGGNIYFRLWVGPPTTVLPIELLNFNGICSKQANSSLLSWQTATETNNNYFTIERSPDALNWIEIAHINGAGNSTHVLSYEYADNTPLHGTNYYRLKQTDYNGSFKYFSIISVEADCQVSTLKIYPNPATNQVTVENMELNVDLLKMKDILGFDMTSKISPIVTGKNSFKIDLSQIEEGIYFLSYDTFIYKLTKQ